MSLLTVEHLHVRYAIAGAVKAAMAGLATRHVDAVIDVSLSIPAGSTLAIVGESGSGKSMSANAAMGLLPETVRLVGGRILLGGTDLLTLDEAELYAVRGRRIEMIFQEPMTALNPVMRVGDQIAEALTAHGLESRADARARAVELLAAVGITDPSRRARDYPHQLSGGMRQRVLIAMALGCKPDFLIADEAPAAHRGDQNGRLDRTQIADGRDIGRAMLDPVERIGRTGRVGAQIGGEGQHLGARVETAVGLGLSQFRHRDAVHHLGHDAAVATNDPAANVSQERVSKSRHRPTG